MSTIVDLCHFGYLVNLYKNYQCYDNEIYKLIYQCDICSI